MLVLTQQRDRPEIPPLDTLPGQPLPGIEDYIGLMQVLHHAHTQPITHHDYSAEAGRSTDRTAIEFAAPGHHSLLDSQLLSRLQMWCDQTSHMSAMYKS